MATKSIQRAIVELQKHGWLDVGRNKGPYRSNRYRIRWPADRNKQADVSGPGCGQLKPSEPDSHVHQTYLGNLPKTFLGRRKANYRFSDRGLYEQRIIQKYGPEAEVLLEELNRISPQDLDALCKAEKEQTLTEDDLSAMRLRLMADRNR